MNLITLKQIIVITFIITLLVICIEHVEDLINYDGNLLTLVKLLSIITIIGLLVTYVVVLERKKRNDNATDKAYIKENDLQFTSEKVESKYVDLLEHIGNPTYYEIDDKKNLNSVTWMAPLNKYKKGFIDGRKNGLDYIKVNGVVGRKHHPIAADMYVIAGKYLDVPQNLLGPLKKASHTINIEQLEVPSELNRDFGKTQDHDIKGKSLVTGSCASVTISAITVSFVEKMLKLEKDGYLNNLSEEDLSYYFIYQYDQELLNYLCREKKPDIVWFSPEDYGEVNVISPPVDKCTLVSLDTLNNNNNNNNNLNNNFTNTNTTKKAS